MSPVYSVKELPGSLRRYATDADMDLGSVEASKMNALVKLAARPDAPWPLVDHWASLAFGVPLSEARKALSDFLGGDPPSLVREHRPNVVLANPSHDGP